MSAQPELKDLAVSALVGLKNDALAGWYNHDKGELTSGFPIAADDVVLTLGHDAVGMANFCAQRGAQIIVADPEPGHIGQVRAQLSSYAGLRLQTHVSEIHRLPLADGSVSRIICSGMLQRVDDPAAVMAELFRVGRPGALYLVIVPGATQELLQKRLAPASYFEKPNNIRIFDPVTFEGLVRSSGLTVDHTISHGFFRALWLTLFWQTGVSLSDAASHPSLDFWARTWAEVLKGDRAREVQSVLDEFLPNSQIIIARKPALAPAIEEGADFFQLTRHLHDGERCDGRVLEHLEAEIRRRFDGAGLKSHPDLPRYTGLQMRRDGLPDWWTAGNNVFLAAPNVKTPLFKVGLYGQRPGRNLILIMGDDSSLYEVRIESEGGLVVLGDKVDFHAVSLNSVGRCTILIGEYTTATLFAVVDARNGGLVYVGADGMWAPGIDVKTDDSHAIRELSTGKRVNRFGGVVILEPHVWLCQSAHLMGDCRVGKDSVVGLGALVRDMELPANSVSVGCPARVIRTDVTWSRYDIP